MLHPWEAGSAARLRGMLSPWRRQKVQQSARGRSPGENVQPLTVVRRRAVSGEAKRIPVHRWRTEPDYVGAAISAVSRGRQEARHWQGRGKRRREGTSRGIGEVLEGGARGAPEQMSSRLSQAVGGGSDSRTRHIPTSVPNLSLRRSVTTQAGATSAGVQLRSANGAALTRGGRAAEFLHGAPHPQASRLGGRQAVGGAGAGNERDRVATRGFGTAARRPGVSPPRRAVHAT